MAAGDETARANGEGSDERVVREEEAVMVSLVGALRRLLSDLFFPSSSDPLLPRLRAAIAGNAASVRLGFRNSSQELLRWTRRGSSLRALFVISVGTVTLLAVTGLLVFMLFFVAATANAIIVSFLISLAAAGGFLAFFFVCVTAIYIAALSLGVFVISTMTIATIIAVLITTGWVGFLSIVWLTAQKCFHLAKHSLSMTGSVVSAYSDAGHVRRGGSKKEG